MVRPLLVAACVACAGFAAAATQGDLARSFERGDRVAMSKHAQAASTTEISTLLNSDNRRHILAAALAAPAVTGAPSLLPGLALAGHSPDRSIALAAARAGLEITRKLNPAAARDGEVLRADLSLAIHRWHALARDGARWSDVRVLALEITRDLAAALANKPSAAVLELADDGDPELRRAAYELLPSPLPAQHAERVGLGIGDSDRGVALAAAVSLCGGLAFGDSINVTKSVGDKTETLVALVLDAALPGGLRLQAAHCLPALGRTGELDKLARTLPKPLADRARALAAPNP